MLVRKRMWGVLWWCRKNLKLPVAEVGGFLLRGKKARGNDPLEEMCLLMRRATSEIKWLLPVIMMKKV